ncbi:hypothetical protein SESBI_47009 [Sesbania bispinosa]|nr:hypothetical protein SESBI_47009 [Sesbania bispinosa]
MGITVVTHLPSPYIKEDSTNIKAQSTGINALIILENELHGELKRVGFESFKSSI